MSFDLQPTLLDARVRAEPLREADFERLYAVAADPLLWEQHPNPTRYRRDVFETYFRGAIESRGALLVLDQLSGEVCGSSRYYEFDKLQRTVAIGYTFIARRYWGQGYNGALKRLMLDHAFRHVERAIFHVGIHNLRSRRAMEKLGAVLIGEQVMSYYGEPSRENVIYAIDRADWSRRSIETDKR